MHEWHREYIPDECPLEFSVRQGGGYTIDRLELRELFEHFLAGDNAAFAELYRELNPRLSAYCYKLVPDHSEDIMQELWERVIAMRKQQKEVDAPVAFLFRMLKNLMVDEHRKRKNETPIENDPPDRTDWSNGIYEQNDSTALEALILEAFEKLSFEDREILVLNIYSGYKFGEIAEMKSKSVDGVWARASRARARLRAIVIKDAKRVGLSLPMMKQNIKQSRHEIIL